MKVLSIGTGAIGTYVGGSLALNGNQAVFLDQPPVVDELQRSGLTLYMEGQEYRIPTPQLASSIETALTHGPFDVAIFALKSFDTAGSVEALRPYRNDLPPILCLQNGVENEGVLAEGLGKDKVIPGTLTSAVGRRGTGSILLERKRGIGVAAGHPLSMRLVAALDVSGLNARLFPNASDMKWSKMLTNLLANATSAILDMSPAEIFSDRRLSGLEVGQLREALRVMRAQGIGVVDLPGTQVRVLAFAVRYIPMGISSRFLVKAVGSGRGGKMPSLHIDLHSGRGMSEVDYLNGAVVRYGRRCGVSTPINQLLNETLLELVRGGQSLDLYRNRPQELINRLQP
jgi:2-dehydropantoate 2-reductase